MRKLRERLWSSPICTYPFERLLHDYRRALERWIVVGEVRKEATLRTKMTVSESSDGRALVYQAYLKSTSSFVSYSGTSRGGCRRRVAVSR